MWNRKEGPPKKPFLWGPLFKGIFPLSPRGNNFFYKKFPHFITEHWGAHLIFINVKLWCMEQKKGAPKETLSRPLFKILFKVLGPRGQGKFFPSNQEGEGGTWLLAPPPLEYAPVSYSRGFPDKKYPDTIPEGTLFPVKLHGFIGENLGGGGRAYFTPPDYLRLLNVLI